MSFFVHYSKYITRLLLIFLHLYIIHAIIVIIANKCCYFDRVYARWTLLFNVLFNSTDHKEFSQYSF